MNAQIEPWDDIRVAYVVARLGTLSAAAEQLNIHHSAVLRRISALEKSLNTRLFTVMLVVMNPRKPAITYFKWRPI
ncbi:MAG: LysR family transcriptional regulator [Psychrobium sp.]|nr:LysR family transcriptional regulator [Psychrobium sp.]